MFVPHNLQNSHPGHVCTCWLTNEYFKHNCIYTIFPIFMKFHVHYFDRSWSPILTVRLTLFDPQLQNFAHSAVSINPSQRIQADAEAALDTRCHDSTQSHCSHWLTDYTQSWALQDWPKQLLLHIFTAPPVSMPLSFLKSHIRVPFWKVSPFVHKPGSLQSSQSDNIATQTVTPATATYRYDMTSGNEVCQTSTHSSDLLGLNAGSNWRSELLNPSVHSKTLNTANFDLI
jgi:hypothetical protein